MALKTLGLHPENAHCAAALYVPLPKSPTNQHRPRPPTARRRRTKAAGPRHDSTLCFQYVNDAATQGYRAGNREPHICPLAACFQHVYVRKRVNTLFFALAGCRCLIPQAFPHGYRAVSLQQPAGGDVSPLFRCRRQRSSSGCRLGRDFQDGEDDNGGCWQAIASRKPACFS